MLKPNVLILVIDSLRSDKCYGVNKSSKTRYIDQLVQNGIFFQNTISSIPATKRATASILTGLHPFNTGAQDDNFLKLDPSIPTFVKILKEHGYHAYGTFPSVFNSTNMADDFENENKFFDPFTGRLENQLGDQIISNLSSKNMQEPWIYYIHLLDLIRPIISHGKFNSKEFGVDQYDQVVSTIDYWLGKILEKIDLNQTLFLITADHGNYPSIIKKDEKIYQLEPGKLYQILWKIGFNLPSFLTPIWSKINNLYKIIFRWNKQRQSDKLNLSNYEKRVFQNAIGHTRDIHEDCLLIPLIISGCGIDSSKKIKNFVRQVDIFPTLLSLLKIPFSKETIDGQDVSNLIDGKLLEECPAYIENLPTKENNWIKQIGIRTNQFKYARNIKNSKKNVELYDIQNDPLEEENLSDKNSDMIDHMESILKNLNIHKNNNSNSDGLDESESKKVEDELRKLGYL